VDTAYVRAVKLRPDTTLGSGYPWDLPAISALADEIRLHPRVTYLIGENGSGKSTLLEAIAVAAGMNAEGGSSSFAFSTRDSHSELWRALRLIKGAQKWSTDFFLRAESLFTAGTYLERLNEDLDPAAAGLAGDPLASYGGRSLHEQSHGESFLAVMINRFDPNGFYLLDEPEAALSTQNCLTCLRRIHELVQQNSQFVIATHSPIILAYPDALIYSFDEDGLHEVDYEDADPVRLTQSFLQARERFLHELLSG
jgi:predicted ATPase